MDLAVCCVWHCLRPKWLWQRLDSVACGIDLLIRRQWQFPASHMVCDEDDRASSSGRWCCLMQISH